MGDRDRQKSAAETEVLKRLRQVCTALPGVAETVDGHGHTTFRAGTKVLAMLGEHEGLPSIGLKTDLHTQSALIRRDDFYPTPYVGQHGWVSTDGRAKRIDWEAVQLVVTATYRRVAPKRLVAQLDKPRRMEAAK
ncbi:MAG: MmcQ/YjbR family DNA-binding protein [Gemmatimonadaceae bacterium]